MFTAKKSMTGGLNALGIIAIMYTQFLINFFQKTHVNILWPGENEWGLESGDKKKR